MVSFTAIPSKIALYLSRNNAVTERSSFGLEPIDVKNEEKSLKRPQMETNVLL